MSGQSDLEPEIPHLVASPESVERTGRARLGTWVSTMVAGLLAGLVIGWAVRGTVSSNEGFVSRAGQTSTSASKDIDSDRNSPQYAFRFRSDEAKPKPTSGSSTKTPASKTDIGAKRPSATPSLSQPPVLPKGAVPLSGSLAPLTPVVTAAPAATADLHAAEARVRTIASELGAKVLEVHDARGTADSAARSIVLSISPSRVDELSDRVRKALGSAAMVEAPVAEAASGTLSEELRTEETVLDQLKERVHQATLDFYPDAPALKSLQSQYADQLKKVQDLRRTSSGPVDVTIVLVGTAS